MGKFTQLKTEDIHLFISSLIPTKISSSNPAGYLDIRSKNILILHLLSFCYESQA